MAAVQVTAILRETGQVDDAKARTAGLAGVRCRLAEVIETGPDELPGHEGVLFHQFELLVRDVGPGCRVEVVRADLVRTGVIGGARGQLRIVKAPGAEG
jgi:hypothetical protein